jgi:AraC family transcriptional regulator of adaptative response/methylated-DNA-[protein]-cysteine methyltransferase
MVAPRSAVRLCRAIDACVLPAVVSEPASPRRDRVEFFPTPASAEAGGYRACRRCRPDQPGRADRADTADARVRRACEAVRRAPDAAWSAARLARASGGSVAQLQRAFRAALGVTPRDYLAACRRRGFRISCAAGPMSRMRRTRPGTDRRAASTARGRCRG